MDLAAWRGRDGEGAGVRADPRLPALHLSFISRGDTALMGHPPVLHDVYFLAAAAFLAAAVLVLLLLQPSWLFFLVSTVDDWRTMRALGVYGEPPGEVSRQTPLWLVLWLLSGVLAVCVTGYFADWTDVLAWMKRLAESFLGL